MLLWKRLRNLLPGAASEIKDIPRDYFTEFVYRSSRSVYCILSNAKRLRDDAKILFDRVSYSTAASISVLSLEESGKACLVQWAERKWLSNEEVLQLLERHFHKQRILAPYMLARALEQLAPIIKDGKVVDLDYSRLLDPTFARQMLDVCYPDVWASLEMLAEGGAFDHFKEIGFYIDVGPYLDVSLMRMPISREEAANLLRCADLGLQAATSGHLTQEAMMLFYKTEVSKRPNREERDKFAILFREARGRGLKGPPAAFGEHKK